MKNTNRLFGLFAAAAILAVVPAHAQVLPVGDDGFVEVDLGFTFNFCGTDYDSVWVNANGSLTFGSGDFDFTESASEMLGDQPRIAALWDDLNPGVGGTVSAAVGANSATFTWDDVPEWFSSGSNTFSVTLKKSSNTIDIDIGEISVSDGLIGVSCGGAITIGNEGGADFSEVAGTGNISLRNTAAYYEQFGFGTNDTENTSYGFSAPNFFHDNSEFNNDLASATSVQLPFNSGVARGSSGGLFTAIAESIDGVYDDIDFFKFSVDAETTLVIEVTNGDLDSLIGLFDVATGALLDVDDDGGVGLLSRLVYNVDTAGQYAVAVTTFPDFDFDGDGFSDGRFVLDVFTFDGTLLDLGDDDFESVDFDCAGGFPYQGGTYSSVYVNSNGNLTFGSGDTDFSESVSEFLSDQPRIAAVWDDLNPSAGGLVFVEQDSDSMTVTFQDVPEFFSTGANNFAVTMTCSTGDVSIAYGSVTSSDSIVGLTEGGGAADPGETDLSAGGPYSVTGTTYERFPPFSSDTFDLDDTTLDFE